MLAYRVTWFVIGCVVGPILWANRAAIIRAVKLLVAKVADSQTTAK